MHLLSDSSNNYVELNNCDYIPTPVSATSGSPFIAPYWHDINLRCSQNSIVKFFDTDVDFVLEAISDHLNKPVFEANVVVVWFIETYGDSIANTTMWVKLQTAVL